MHRCYLQLCILYGDLKVFPLPPFLLFTSAMHPLSPSVPCNHCSLQWLLLNKNTLCSFPQRKSTGQTNSARETRGLSPVLVTLNGLPAISEPQEQRLYIWKLSIPRPWLKFLDRATPQRTMKGETFLWLGNGSASLWYLSAFTFCQPWMLLF